MMVDQMVDHVPVPKLNFSTRHMTPETRDILFDAIDTNKDGKLSRSEIYTFLAQHGASHPNIQDTLSEIYAEKGGGGVTREEFNMCLDRYRHVFEGIDLHKLTPRG